VAVRRVPRRQVTCRAVARPSGQRELAVEDLGLHQWGGIVGEYRVVAVDREQFALALRGLRVLPPHPAHDQPGGDLLALGRLTNAV